MYLKKLSKLELVIMKFIWNLDIKTNSYEIIDYMKEEHNLPEKVALKILSKLSKKKILICSRNRQVYVLYSCNKRKDIFRVYIKKCAKSFEE